MVYLFIWAQLFEGRLALNPEMRLYALNCTGIKDGNAKGAPVSPYQLPVGDVPAFFHDLILHMPRHHTAACIAMQLVTPSNSDKLPGILGFPLCSSIFSTSTASKHLRFTTATSWKQIFSPHPIVVIFLSHKY